MREVSNTGEETESKRKELAKEKGDIAPCGNRKREEMVMKAGMFVLLMAEH